MRADYDSHESLKDAFKGQDAVISLVGGMAIGDQNKLIDAAIAAGAKRFLPSEYGCNTADKRTHEIVPFFKAKSDTLEYLKSKEKEISWTAVATGPFFDWIGFVGLDAASKSATIFDDGKTVFSTTKLAQIGVAVANALKNADSTKNQWVYISGFQTTQNEILAAAEKVTGTQWSVKHATVKGIIEDGRAKIQKGDLSGILPLLQGVTFSSEQLGDFSPLGLWNEKLGIPKESLEEALKAIIA